MLIYILVLYCVFIFADIDVHSGVVQTQAGVVLEKLDTQLGEHGLWIFTMHSNTAVIDVLWGQPIKLIQVVSTSEFHEYWWNDLEIIFLVPAALQSFRS